MTNLPVKGPHYPRYESVETACRRFDMCLAGWMVAAAEAGDGELLRMLLDAVAWIDSTRLVAAASARLN